MPGIYIHIPYCVQACAYCNFHFSTVMKTRADFISSLVNESNLRSDFLGNQTVDTLYFGGGTPSLLNKEEWQTIMNAIQSNYNIDREAEFTVEVNPDDLTKEKLEILARFGVNRLSIGVQSFNDAELKSMNRAHDSRQGIDSIRLAQEVGFKNISIDLIYGIPGMNSSSWNKTLEFVETLDIQHLSCYSLTVEEGTLLAHDIKTKKLPGIQDSLTAQCFEALMDWAPGAGFIHYEISNFGREGYFSKHNTSYWKGDMYLGLGPSAHSYDGHSRYSNVANNSEYIHSIGKGNFIPIKEEMTKAQRYNEYVLVSLRTIWGVDLKHIEAHFGIDFLNYFNSVSEQFLLDGSVEQFDQKIKLTRKGKLYADSITMEYFQL